MIDAEIQKLIAAAHERVRETLSARRPTLEALAKRLIEKEVVDRDALTQLIAETGGATAALPVVPGATNGHRREAVPQ